MGITVEEIKNIKLNIEEKIKIKVMGRTAPEVCYVLETKQKDKFFFCVVILKVIMN